MTRIRTFSPQYQPTGFSRWLLSLEEGADIQTERFSSKLDAREDETIQSALVKMIERSEAKTVSQTEGVSVVV